MYQNQQEMVGLANDDVEETCRAECYVTLIVVLMAICFPIISLAEKRKVASVTIKILCA